jgi:hypothetical protein
MCCVTTFCWQAPGLLQVLQHSVAKSEDIFFLNFGRWHFTNCKGLQEEPYKRALQNLGKLYEVRCVKLILTSKLLQSCYKVAIELLSRHIAGGHSWVLALDRLQGTAAEAL